jgi:signal peptidase I
MMGRFARFFFAALSLGPGAFLSADEKNRRPLTYLAFALGIFLIAYYCLWPYDPLAAVYFPFHLRSGVAQLDAVSAALVAVLTVFVLLTLPVVPPLLLKHGWHGLTKWFELAAYVFAAVWLFIFLVLIASALVLHFNLLAAMPAFWRGLILLLALLFALAPLFRLFMAVLPCSWGEAVMAVLLFLAGLGATNYFVLFKIARLFVVLNTAMAPAMMDGDVFLAGRWDYHHRLLPARGDIIVFDKPGYSKGVRVSRVIALPGDRIAVDYEFVFLNGRKLEYALWPQAQRFRYSDKEQRSYSVRLADEWLGHQFGETVILSAANPDLPYPPIPDGPSTRLQACEYFVLGDNRANADDSRNPEHGPVRCSEIDGIAVAKLLPLFSRENPLRHRFGQKVRGDRAR